MRLDRLLLIFAIASTIITGILLIYVHEVIGIPRNEQRLEYFKSLIELLRIVLISFFVGIAVVLLRDIFQERKYDFETKTKAKELYTEAKTSIDYLPYRFQFIGHPHEIYPIIEDLHRKKHLAETYHQYLPVKNKRAKRLEQRIWTDDPYDKLNKLTRTIQQNSLEWSGFSEKKRFELMDDVYKSIDENKTKFKSV